MNWPHKAGGLRGEPDRDGSLAPIVNNDDPQAPVVWETYMAPNTVFVDIQMVTRLAV
ncbi:MAG: hypothetical protein U9Q81_15650 [Pseudomonadota bacterium]|nr:hypothetical protein [Pseudomonadota bacterium]